MLKGNNVNGVVQKQFNHKNIGFLNMMICTTLFLTIFFPVSFQYPYLFAHQPKGCTLNCPSSFIMHWGIIFFWSLVIAVDAWLSCFVRSFRAGGIQHSFASSANICWHRVGGRTKSKWWETLSGSHHQHNWWELLSLAVQWIGSLIFVQYFDAMKELCRPINSLS